MQFDGVPGPELVVPVSKGEVELELVMVPNGDGEFESPAPSSAVSDSSGEGAQEGRLPTRRSVLTSKKMHERDSARGRKTIIRPQLQQQRD